MATTLSEEQQQKGTRLSHIIVRELVHHKTGRFNLTVLAGEAGLENKIESDQIHRPGLALAGFLDLFAFDRIQVLGNTEIRYLTELSHENRTHAIKTDEFPYPLPGHHKQQCRAGRVDSRSKLEKNTVIEQ